MLHLFADPADMQGELLIIRGPEVNHMKNVMRLKPGEEISVSNGIDQKEYRYGLEEYEQEADGTETARLRLRFVKENDVELPVKVWLFQGLPKADKMDLVVQKCVELGVYQIVPVAMQRCIMKLTPDRAEKKVERWQKISEAAAMQSRRRIVPKITMPMTMTQALAFAREHCSVRVLPYELQENDGSTKGVLEKVKNAETAAVFIGPEGGFDPEEVAAAREAGFCPISLGRRILRTETAGFTVMAWLIYLTEIS